MIPLTIAAVLSVAAPQSEEPYVLPPAARICFIGNTLPERMQHDGWLETLLHARHPDDGLVIRNLAFSGDELNLRLRSRGFGTPDEHLALQGTDVVFAFFGYGESFDGAEGLPEFRGHLERFLKRTTSTSYNPASTASVVLFSPIAHEDLADPNIPAGGESNTRLALYSAAMAEVAKETGTRFVDLFAATRALYEATEEPLTINGIHLNSLGNRLLAEFIVDDLFGAAAPVDWQQLTKLREAVLDKNFHWFHRYRTTDGYSIYGGRGGLKFVEGQTNREVANRELAILDEMTTRRDHRINAIAHGGDLTINDEHTSPFLEVTTNKPGKGPGGEHVYLSGEDAIGKMTVAEGMEVGLFASEQQFPELVNPVQVAVDPKGRLWVASWPGYPHWKPKSPMNDKLLILPDEDRDGRADRCIVFADGLHNPTGFEFYNGGVYVAQAPDLWFLKDTDGDDVADLRIRVLHGLDSADTHHTSNSFVLDPGGALYFQEGTFHHTQVETPHGPVVRVANGAVFRYEPRTHRFEVYVSYGFANPHGHVFDRWGQDFVTDGTGAVPYYGTSFSGHVNFPNKHAGAPRVYQQRTRPCGGTEILSSAHFPADNQGNWLVSNCIGFRGVLQYEFSDDGSGFTGHEVEPIMYSSDPNFRPVDLEVGSDGAIYIADWHNTIIGHMQHNLRDPSRDILHGRIYRVTHRGRALSPPVEIAGRPIPDLLVLLMSPEDRVRYRARIELSARDSSEVVRQVTAWISDLDPSDPDHEHHMMEALWVHQHHNAVNEELLGRMLRSPDFRARAAATRVLCAWRDQVEDPLALLMVQAEDEHPRVRLEAVRACSYIPSAESAEVALAATKHPTDRFLDYTLAETIKTLEPQWSAAIASGQPIPRDNPVGATYLLRRVSDEDLAKMARTESVLQAMLDRGKIARELRTEALTSLAKQRGTRAVDELLDAILRQDQSPGGSLDDLHELLVSWDPGELAAARSRLVELAQTAAAAPVRAGAWSAIVTADGNPERAWAEAVTSPRTIVDLLRGVPLIKDDDLRAGLYHVVRALIFELPDELADDNEGEEEGRRSGVRFTLYHERKFPNVALSTLERLTPRSTGEVEKFTLDVPGRRADSFAVTLRSTLVVPAAGDYTFYVSSDDGSRFYINGQQLIDNDGLHGTTEKSGKIRLSRGSHEVVVTYYDNGGAESLKASWSGPGIDKQEIPTGALFIDSAASIQRLAVQALGHLPSHHTQRFVDLAELIRSGTHRDVAVESMLRIDQADRPRAQAAALARDFTTIAAETPFALRNTLLYEQTLDLGRQLVTGLPAEEAARVTDALETLELIVIRIGAVPAVMRWDLEEFTVVAGKPVKIIFENEDAMPHNLLISTPGSLQEIGKLADEMAADPKGFDKHFAPDSDKVLWTSKLVHAGQKAELDFVAPAPGDYPFICTFPGHWRSMNGVMRVLADE